MPAGANAPDPEQKRLFLEGGGTICQREKVPPPSNSLPLPARFIRTNFSANDGTVPHRCKHAVIRRPGTCRDAVKRWCCTQPGLPLPAWYLPGRSGKTEAFCATARCGIPACLRIPVPSRLDSPTSPLSTTFFLRSLKQPIGSCRCAEICPYRPSPMKDAGAAHRPLPRKKGEYC